MTGHVHAFLPFPVQYDYTWPDALFKYFLCFCILEPSLFGFPIFLFLFSPITICRGSFFLSYQPKSKASNFALRVQSKRSPVVYGSINKGSWHWTITWAPNISQPTQPKHTLDAMGPARTVWNWEPKSPYVKSPFPSLLARCSRHSNRCFSHVKHGSPGHHNCLRSWSFSLTIRCGRHFTKTSVAAPVVIGEVMGKTKQE